MAISITLREFYRGQPKIADYREPTWADLATNLRVTRRAQQARRGLTHDDATALLAAEEEIESECHRYFDTLSKHCRARQDHCSRIDAEFETIVDAHPATIEHVRQDAFAEIGRMGRKATQQLANLRHAVVAATNDLAAFKLQHQRDMDAQYPASRFLHVTVLLAMVAVETMLNAYFFKEDSEDGLLGGIVKAMLVSTANVLLSFVVGGLLLRNMRHVGLAHQLVALALFIPFVGAIVGFNLLVAHYRALLERGTPNAMSAAWDSWLANPWQMGSVGASVLFILGAVAATVACLDALLIDDPYPGYGRIDRRWRDAITERDEALAGAEREIGEIATKVKTQIDAQRKAVSDAFAHRAEVERELTIIGTEFAQRKRHLAELRQTALTRFRDLVRTGSFGPDASSVRQLWMGLRRLLGTEPAPLPAEMLDRSEAPSAAPAWLGEELPNFAPAPARVMQAKAMDGCDAVIAEVRADIKRLQESLREPRGQPPLEAAA